MEKDMTKGSPLRLLLELAVPLFFGSCLQQVYSIVDSVVVGRFVGTGALAAVGSTGALTFLIIGFIQGLTHGFSIRISQCFGARDAENTRRAVLISLALSALFSAAVGVLGVLLSRPLLVLLGTPQEILSDAVCYLSIVLGGTAALIFYNITSSILRAFGNSMVPFASIAVCTVLNIVLDLVFVLVLHWGVAGAAWATVISQAVSGLLCLLAMLRIEALWQKQNARPGAQNLRMAAELLRLGLPVGIMNSVTAVGMVLLQSIVNSLGALAVAAYAIGCKIEGVADQATGMLGLALGSYVGQNEGAGDLPRIRRGVRTAALLSLVCSAVIFFVLAVFGRQLAGIFVQPGEDAVAQAAYPYLFVCGAMMWMLGLLFVFRNALQSLGDTIIPMFSGFLELAARISVALALPAALGFYRICFAEVSAWVAATALLCFGYFRRMRRLERTRTARTDLPDLRAGS